MPDEPGPSVASSAGVDGCANCGTPLRGPFCSACGQENRNLTRISLRQLVNDWLGDVFSFDSRLFRTLVPLVGKPGFLTQEYLAGRRARYVPPLRLFVFISLLMFLVLGLTGGVKLNWSLSQGGEEVVTFSSRAPEPGDQVAGEIPEKAPGQEKARGAIGEDGEAVAEPDILDDPAEINRRILQRLPQAMFVLAPVFALFLWFLHRRRSPYYVPHFIFSLHIHCFWFLLMTVGALVDLPFPPRYQPGNLLIFVGIAVYVYLAQRRVYGGGWLANVLRTAVLGFAQMFAFLAVLLSLLLLAVALT